MCGKSSTLQRRKILGLTKTMLKYNKQKLNQIFKKHDVVFAYLFGSQVSGKTNSESDVDIAVYLDENCADFFKTRLTLIEKLQALFRKDVEVIILNEQKSIFFKFVIIKEGQVLFEQNHSKRVGFELETMRDYYDYQPFLRAYNYAYLERGLSKI
ncbi:hypothetical protein COT20_01245 [bacterium (Candidatus Gribaldobacteria) CG08_land_8_20_14_0_20_39_15]|uniref:Polymerase beta nucleotidyltransferase domain-containing protein n=1 Tax=bacterium (Candidatus Gribaldobacteria) CG08_land_8_20_14_0_20_39_15 TaxID=2014273 RepID=A0A2M6XUU0_9BACT|nr:MAG: hypothetical protein COT20_01245 [bacterium (Candidatus Gribaldobacteria) CG08_land_8_20_14_0_20_39_15]